MNLETFQALPTEQIADLVREFGPSVCAFPINGTRRWFMLEHPPKPGEDVLSAYLDVAGRRHVELYGMFFEHGVPTLLTPVFGPDILDREQAYVRMAIEGLSRLATHPDFVDFYHTQQVRVRFYGDYRRHFDGTPFAHLADLFEQISAQTEKYDRHRLFFGLFAHDAAETVAEISVRFYQERGRLPTRDQIIAAYYGEYVEPVDVFIGFDKLSAFDMPLVATGSEDLYFTVSPSPYLTPTQLRHILYDHLYSRRHKEPDYATIKQKEWAWMRAFYQANLGRTLGVGRLKNGFWYPLPQVERPENFD